MIQSSVNLRKRHIEEQPSSNTVMINVAHHNRVVCIDILESDVCAYDVRLNGIATHRPFTMTPDYRMHRGSISVQIIEQRGEPFGKVKIFALSDALIMDRKRHCGQKARQFSKAINPLRIIETVAFKDGEIRAQGNFRASLLIRFEISYLYKIAVWHTLMIFLPPQMAVAFYLNNTDLRSRVDRRKGKIEHTWGDAVFAIDPFRTANDHNVIK